MRTSADFHMLYTVLWTGLFGGAVPIYILPYLSVELPCRKFAGQSYIGHVLVDY